MEYYSNSQIENADKKGDRKTISKIMKNLAGKRKCRVKPTCNLQTGEAYGSNTEALFGWHAMFAQRSVAPACDTNKVLPELPDDGRDADLSYEKFEECVLSMKYGKAPGPDDMWSTSKNSPDACRLLYTICKKVWVCEKVHAEFILGHMCMVHKEEKSRRHVEFGLSAW